MLTHPFEPVWDKESRMLILGSFPSVKSREQGFYYGHPRNRFWKVISTIFEATEPEGEDVPGKIRLLKDNGIALFDVISSCDISGSSDSSIKNVTVNDLTPLLADSHIGRKIFVNGRKAQSLYMKYTYPMTNVPCIYLPSTSPANAAFSVEKLVEEWSRAFKEASL